MIKPYKNTPQLMVKPTYRRQRTSDSEVFPLAEKVPKQQPRINWMWEMRPGLPAEDCGESWLIHVNHG